MAKAKKATAAHPYQHLGLSVEDQAKLTAVIAGIKKDHGAGSIGLLDEAPNMGRFSQQVPSGSIGLDIAIGPMKRRVNGQWQTGLPPVTLEVFGPESCGKTTLILCQIASAQAAGGLCAMIDMEHALDPLWAKALGVQMDKLFWCQPKTGDEALQIAEALLKSGLYQIIALDSVAALLPKSEDEGDVGDSHVGLQARLMSQFFRKVGTSFGEGAKTTLIMINQIREKVGVKFGSPEITPGGRALKFAASLRLDIRRTKAIKEGGGQEEDDGNLAAQIGHRMRVKCIKNKVAPPFRMAEFSLIYGKGIDILEELIDLCIVHGVDIVQSAAWYKLDDHNYNGKAKLYEYLQQDNLRTYKLYDALLCKNMLNMGYNPDGTPIPGALEVTESQHAQFEPPTKEELKEVAEQEKAGDE